MRKLLVAHLAGERGVSAAAAATSAAAPLAAALRKLGIKVSESLHTRNLLKLAPETRDLSSELDLELGIGRLVLGKMLFRLIEGDESVLDAACELDFVGHLPRLESLEILVEDGGKLLSQVRRGPMKHAELRHCMQNALEGLDQTHGRIQERLLQLAHRLKDMARAEGNHECSEKHANIDFVRMQPRNRRIFVKEDAEKVDALEALPGNSDNRLLAEKYN